MAGIVAAAGGLPRETDALLRRMIHVQRHRGPDDVGFLVEPADGVGLAFCRLSIIDLVTGHQPLGNEDGTVWVVFNGEIYNFQELRDRLVGLGHRFATRSDTEVIVHAYEQYGERCVEHLRGMFAFAVWDRPRRQLFLARDRLGKKPLFYYAGPGVFLFASEPRAILQDARVAAEPAWEAIHQYLTYGYVPSPASAFRGFHKLPPAHWLTLRDGQLRVERYWRLRYRPKLTLDEGEIRAALLDRLREAVRLRMISDVPLGAFLSGGIDSSTVVALMSEVSAGPVKTFSIGFEEDEYNELPYARLVAERYGTTHHEFVVKPDALEVLPQLVWHYSEPYADSSAIPTYYLSKMTRQHVTVALNGDGGDENFAGYERYLASLLAARYDRLPRLLRAALARGFARLPDRRGGRGLYRKGRRFVGALATSPVRRYGGWVSIVPDALKAELYTDGFREAMVGEDPLDTLYDAFATAEADNLVDRTLAVDVSTYLPDDLLVKIDIASMAHSLEARSPLVDHVFMEFAASIPWQLKLRGRTTKWILKQAVRPLLPAAVVERPKMGFGVPIDRWFRRELREMAYETLLAPRSVGRGLFRPEVVRRLLDEHARGAADWHFPLWALLCLELWFQHFIDGPASGGGS